MDSCNGEDPPHSELREARHTQQNDVDVLIDTELPSSQKYLLEYCFHILCLLLLDCITAKA